MLTAALIAAALLLDGGQVRVIAGGHSARTRGRHPSRLPP